MRIFWTCALILAVPAVGVAAQQAEHIVPEGTTIRLLLLRQKSVQQELKVSPELARKVVEFTDKESDAYRNALKLGKEGYEKKCDELEKEEKKFLEENLTAGQRRRLNQITLQVTGLRQLTRPDVAKALGLTEAQQKKAREMRTEARKELEKIMSAKSPRGRNEKLAKFREDVDKKIAALLTPEQKAKARKLVGEPFKGEILFEEPREEPKEKPGK